MITVARFKAEYPLFAARSEGRVQRALDTARVLYSVDVCGELHEAIVMAHARWDLLLDPQGAPTGKTKDSNTLADQARAYLDDLLGSLPRGYVCAG